MYKIFKSKKGVAIDDFLPLLFIVIVFVIALLVFTVTNTNKKNIITNNIEWVTKKIDASYNLMVFLRTPINDQENIADLIVLSSSTDNFDNFQSRAEEYFNKIYGADNWRLEIIGEDADKTFGGKPSSSPHSEKVKILLAEQTLPTISGKLITVDLFSIKRVY